MTRTAQHNKNASLRPPAPARGAPTGAPLVRAAQDGRLELGGCGCRLVLRRLPSALVYMGVLSFPSAFAADKVTTVSPANSAFDVALDADLSAALSGAETSGLDNQSFVIHYGQTARAGANVVSGVGTTSITLEPFAEFHPGERVRATVTDDVQTSMGSIEPHTWSFRARVEGGSGRFTLSAGGLGSDYSWEVALGDLDADGDLDAWVANYKGPPNQIWLNDGDGGFYDSGQTLGATDSYANDIVLGDLNGDGYLDALVIGGGYYTAGENLVWINDGSAGFTSSGQTLGTGFGYAAALGDVDGDGDLDAWIAVHGEYNVSGAPNRVWLNDGSGWFSDTGQALGNEYSTGVELGDVDGDGHLDAWVTNYYQPNQVWLNDGSGVFSDSGQSLGGDNRSNSVALGDLDGDGDLDAWISAGQGDPNQVWLNVGNGVFSDSGQAIDAGPESMRVQLGDVDGDGDLDAWSTRYDLSSKLWLNGGNGSFTDSGNYPGASTSIGVALGDVDGDGDLDAFVVNYFGEANRVWLNKQDGGDAPAPFPTLISHDGPAHGNDGTGPRLGSLVDLETDGLPLNAAATGDDFTGQVGVIDEDGLTIGTLAVGNVSASLTVEVQGAAGRLDAWVDFDGDGSFDGADEQIFTSRSIAIGSTALAFGIPADARVGGTFGRFRISTAGGLGPRGAAVDGEVEDHAFALTTLTQGYDNFAAGASLGAGNNGTSRSVALGDLDGDLDLDALVANNGGNVVWVNDGSGVLAASGQTLGGADSRGVALGDLDRDGDLDAFVTNYGTNRVWFNADGNGSFVAGSQSLGTADSRGVALGDVDLDGLLDAVVANAGANRVWLNEGSIIFAAGTSLGTASNGVALGDVDGDGVLDALFANAGGNRVWLNDGNGNFSDSGQSLGTSTSNGVALGDVDGDGALDAVFANAGGNRVWLNDGSAGFIDSGQSLGTSTSTGVAIGDVDGDGYPDLVFANTGAGNRVWLNDGSAGFSDSGNSLGNGNSHGFALGDVDGDGDVDVYVANSSPNRVWLNQPEADGGDGFPDTVDNCPDVVNPDQKDMNGDGIGNQCDPNTDGDSLENDTGDPGTSDPDDDNDGVLDVDEGNGEEAPFNSLDPDRDNDGIIDGLDRERDSPEGSSNNLCLGQGADANFMMPVFATFSCAATNSITTSIPANVTTADGDLLMISPTVIFGPGFHVGPDGRLSVISRDPTAPIPNPPDG